MPPVAGLLLAAGGGRRMGTPKALVADEHGYWLPRAVAALRAGGCGPIAVVLGAEAERARALLPEAADVFVVVAADWASGQSASLRAGLAALERHAPDAPAAAVTLVDLPTLAPAAVQRLAAQAGPADLRQAHYEGRPGHPVLLGRAHWGGVARAAHGDEGARGYLREHGASAVECGDLGDGCDVDAR